MNKKNYLRRLMAIYIAFFAVLLISFVLDVVPNFQRGIDEGIEMGTELSEVIDEPKPRSIYMLWNIPIRRSEPIEIASNDPERTIKGYISTLSCEVSEPLNEKRDVMQIAFAAIGNSPWIYALMILSALIFPVIIVLMFLIIRSVRNSIREERPLGAANAVLLRSIALLTIASELFGEVGMWLMSRRAAEVLAGTGYTVDAAFHFDYSVLVMGILLLFAAEVFKIGRDMSEEQRLTI